MREADVSSAEGYRSSGSILDALRVEFQTYLIPETRDLAVLGLNSEFWTGCANWPLRAFFGSAG